MGATLLKRAGIFLLFALLLSLPVGTASAEKRAQPLSVKASTKFLEFGKVVRITGAPGARFSGRKVVLQKKYGKNAPWRVERTRRVDSNGNFKIPDRPTSMNKRWYRVVMPKSGGRPARVSNTVLVKVLRWYFLSELRQVDSERFDEGRASIGGRSFPKSVMNRSTFWWEANPWAEWNLARRCRALRATVGLLDSSPSTSKSGFSAYRDGSLTTWGPLGIGQRKAVWLPVVGTFRLKLQNNYAGGSDGGMAGWGNARVFCTRKPR